MAFEFKLPELGENIETADVVGVLVSVGDKVEVDQSLLEIETDKATVEVPSEVAGVVKEVKIKEGEQAKVGQVLFVIDTEGSAVEEKLVEKEEAKPGPEKAAAEEVKDEKPVEEVKPAVAGGIVEFELPELGENIETADITKVLVAVGDTVEADQPVIEIETDKATVEVPVEVGGVVKEVKVKDGDTAKVGQVILVIEATGGVKSEKSEVRSKKEEVRSEKVDEVKAAEPEAPKQEKIVTPAQETKSISVVSEIDKRIVPAAPSVRRFAREIGIDIHQVKGSGPGGRISVEDVKRFSKLLNEGRDQSHPGAPAGGIGSLIPVEELPDFSKWGSVEKQKMSNIRRKTSEHLSYSWATIPHVTQFDKADITELEKMRKQFKQKAEEAGGKLTPTAILLKVVASALKVFPQFNSSVDMANQEVIYKQYYNIGVAVDTDRGLLVPVIRDVDKKNIIELSIELTELSKKARDKKLTLEDMQGGTFTISNLGGIAGTYFTPVVNSPEVAILGVSKSAMEQVYDNGEFVPKFMMPLSLSYDHRIIDGADGARFIKWIIEALENPFLLSLEG